MLPNLLLLLGIVVSASSSSSSSSPVIPVPGDYDNSASRIVKGETGQTGQFPHQALLFIRNAGGRIICGGTLLNNRWILTAGHCALRASDIVAHLGARTYDNLAEPGRQVVEVRDIVMHHAYNALYAANDVALLELDRPATFSDTVQPARLPAPHAEFVGAAVVASGWGLRGHSKGSFANLLQFAPLQVIENQLCQPLYNPLVVRESTICAKGLRGQSVCNGDSGGPLVLVRDGRTLVGVTSFGHVSGCHSGQAQGFARVSSYLDWIRRHTRNMCSYD